MEKSQTGLFLSFIFITSILASGCSSQATKLSALDDDENFASNNTEKEIVKNENQRHLNQLTYLERLRNKRKEEIEEGRQLTQEVLGFSPIESQGFSPIPMEQQEQGSYAGQIAFNNFTRPTVIFNDADTWDRVITGMRLGGFTDNTRVQHFIDYYMKNPEQIERIARRSAIYMHMIVEEVQRRNMPTEIALLPFVESAFKPTAYSRSHAAGLWQFIPSTGKSYGLTQTSSYDGRMDPFAATGAALDYLGMLANMFDGDWLLALASYNAGQGTVSRTIKRQGGYANYWELDLPQETMEYVPRLLAYREIIMNHGYFNIELPIIPNRARLAQIRVDKSVNLKHAASMAGLHVSALVDLNPCFKKGITTPRYSTRIIAPLEHAEQLADVIYRLPVAQLAYEAPTRYKKYSKKVNSSKKRRKTYRVRRGETLFKIAKKYGTSVKRLMKINRLRSSKVQAGVRLIIS